MTVGERIRVERERNNISQVELANVTGIGQSYISQIETGRVKPSSNVLTKISASLGRPKEFFTSGEIETDVILCYIDDSTRYYSKSDFETAMVSAQRALDLSFRSESTDIRALCELQLGLCCQRSGDINYAAELLEDALMHFKRINDIEHTSRSLFELGNVNFRMEKYKRAEYYYGKCVCLTSGKKRLQSLYLQSTIYHASSLFRIGEFEQCTKSYLHAWKVAKEYNEPVQVINAGLGLGWVMYRTGDLETALNVTRQIRELSKRLHPELMPSILHNFSIYLHEKGSVTEAQAVWRECYRLYRSLGNAHGLINLLEEKWNRLISEDAIEEAETTIQIGLDLLQEHEEASILRGRIYRALGDCHFKRGQSKLCKHYYQLAIGYFQKVNANDEVLLVKKRFSRLSR